MFLFRNSMFLLFLVVGRLVEAEDAVVETIVIANDNVNTNTCQQQENLLTSCTMENNGYRSKIASLENQLQQMTDTLTESQTQGQALRTMHTDLMKSLADDSELLRKQLSSLEIQLQQATDALAKSQSQDRNNDVDDDDDASLMELLVKSAKGKLLSSVPPTDKECTFDWVIGKCTPMCHCRFRPQWGDYSPSRACRLIVPHTGEAAAGYDQCEEDETKERPWAVKLAEEGRYHAEKIAKEAHHHIQQGAKQALTKLREVAPPTDEDCMFSLQSLRCEPLDLCVWDFQLGDFSPHRACRHKLTSDGEQDFVL